ncbi:MAG: amidase [Pseudohongiellaceae bacterium]
MLSKDDYLKLDAFDQAAGLRSRDFSSCELMQAAIARAKEVNPILNAISSPNFEQAIAQAQAFDGEQSNLARSPLAGLPFLIKDLTPVKGLGHNLGSSLYAGNQASTNSNIVHKYLDAGLLIMGKTNTPEFGLTLTTEPTANGATLNPWNIQYSTGGSSGGAAAAVAAGILPAAHATDGGGSIRIPAANCGLVGLKPSRGLTSIENEMSACWSGMSVGHVVSQTVRDSAAYLDLICLEKPHLFPKPNLNRTFASKLTTPLHALKIGIQLEHPLGQSIDAECRKAVETAAKHCQQLGHEVREISHPVDYKAATAAMGKIINTHVYQTVKQKIEERGMSIEDSPLEASTKLMASVGKTVSADAYVSAIDTLKIAEQAMSEFHQEIDLVISPVLSLPPAKIGWLNMNSSDMREYGDRYKQYSGFTAIYNGTGQPSLSLPLHLSSAGLPVGVMFTGAWGADQLLLNLAKQLEEAYPWPRRAPMA